MGHDIHFLERLSRVEQAEMELALGLYRDPPLLQHLLAQLELGPESERVAIALSSGEEPPHLVVARDGGFVTCLGRGMSTGELPRMSWRRLNQLSGRIERLRERLAQAERYLQERHEGEIDRLFRRLITAGAHLSREDYLALSTLRMVNPLLMIMTATRLGSELYNLRDHLMQRQERRLMAQGKSNLHQLYAWNTLWGSIYANMLVAESTEEELERYAGSLGSEVRDGILALHNWNAIRFDDIRAALLGIWTSARFGKQALGSLKRMWREAQTLHQLLSGGLGIFGVAMRHTKLRAECRKVLETPPPLQTTDRERGLIYYDMLLKTFDNSIQHVELAVPFATEMARASLSQLEPPLVEELLKVLNVQEWPEDFLRTVGSYLHQGYLMDSDGFIHLMLLAPWAAMARGEELFFPNAWMDPLRPRNELTLGLARKMFQRHFEHSQDLPPPRARTVKRFGKQDPCPCGSGKNYGRCCRR